MFRLLYHMTSAMVDKATETVFTFLLIALPRNLSSMPASQTDSLGFDHTPTCQLPTTQKGQEATLTCDFKRDVSNQSFQVWHFELNVNKAGRIILDCYKFQPDKPCEDENSMYRRQGIATQKIVLSFVANETTDGGYECLTSDNKDRYLSKRCFLQLDYQTTSKADIQEDAIIGIIVGVLVTLALLIVLAVLFWRKRIRGDNLGPIGDGNNSPRSGRAVNRRQPGVFQRLWNNCCTPIDSDSSHDASLMTSVTTSTADQMTPVEPCVDSGIDVLDYPSCIEKINFSSVSCPEEKSIHTAPDSDNPLSSSAAQNLLRPYIVAMEKLRREMEGPTPSKSTHGKGHLIEIGNVDHGIPKIEIVTAEPAANAANQSTGRTHTVVSDHLESSESSPDRPIATDWPPLYRLQEQKVWTEQKLIPYVSCTQFPRTSQEVNRQLAELFRVQESIQCRLEDLKEMSTGRFSFDVSQLQDVINKLEYAKKQAATRQEALKELLKSLVKVEHVVQNCIDKMDRASRLTES